MRRVNKRKTRELEALTRRISTLDAASIDQLYGLEPVYEPGGMRVGHDPQEFVAVQCPWCGERFDTCVDLTAGELTYIEDCQVCCQPIELAVELEENGALHAVKVQRLD
jgi:hypothetical protein